MSGFDDRHTAVAKVYAIAILELAERKGEEDSLLEELQELASYLDENPDFDAFLSSPMIEDSARERVIEKVFRSHASDLLVDALQIINRKGRLELLRAIVETYRLADQERRGIVDVSLTTAVPLSDGMRARIKEVVKRSWGKEANLSETVDASLLGGLVLQIEDQKIDTSMARQLAAFRVKLLDRASLEIQSRQEAYFAET